ncbi:MAG: hypothetical protein ACR2N5_06915, partial [Solirubrobacterales bacterium]
MAQTNTRQAGIGKRGFARVLLLGALAAVLLATVAADDASAAKVRGQLKSADKKLGSTPVTLYRAGTQNKGPRELGRSTSRRNGKFAIRYDKPRGSNAVLYLVAGDGNKVRLATVLGLSPFPSKLIVNERTTVAAGFALAQFLSGNRKIAGRSPGLQNASEMFKNVVNARKGRLVRVLKKPPNGEQTPTIETFNSLANLLPRCVRDERRCANLFSVTNAPGESKAKGTLKATANIARNPGNNAKRIFNHSLTGPTPYQPAVLQTDRPRSWTLALRFDGDGK